MTAESVPRYLFGANLMIPAQICDEFSCGQGKVYGQDRLTDMQRQYHFSLKGHGVKINYIRFKFEVKQIGDGVKMNYIRFKFEVKQIGDTAIIPGERQVFLAVSSVQG